ncbi:unnamed protein product [Candida verbasci]|uniref:Uncharacterized protein n=1 Tax=Candida verbasci TaxID=1227364 RepID=A0A9W4XAX5_9ASCO|nr:unnamed protein product [Candida verbasci]
MSTEQVEISLPNSVDKYPNPLANFTKGIGYPKWEPIDTKKQVSQILRFGFYTTVGSYAWIYLWKRSTFKIGVPIAAVSFFAIAKGLQSSLANLREKNDSWNVFWALGAANTIVLTAGFKNLPPKHKLLSGIFGTCLVTLIDRAWWASATSSISKNANYELGQINKELPKQGFWDVWSRRPITQTVEELGIGRGIVKNEWEESK